MATRKAKPAGNARKRAARAPRKRATAGKAAPKGGRRAPSPAEARPGRRADFGSPTDAFFARQPPPLRAILDELRRLVEEAAPDAESSIKWGMPFYSVNGEMMCALGAHRAHVNLVLAGPPDAFEDPEGRLSGEGKTGRHLKLTSADELPLASIRGWLRTAARLARGGERQSTP